MKKIAVVILNWNGRSLLEQFLPSVIANSSSDISDVIVADNASSDDSVEYLENNYPSVGIIKMDKNYGFAEGYNRALANLDYEYFVLLNSDVQTGPLWLEPLLEQLESDKTIAAAQPKIKSYNNKNEFEYAGACGGYIDFLAYPFCRGRIMDNVEVDKGQYDSVKEVFWASGAALFVRAKLYNEMGGLDSDFFAHMEEIDFCWRLKLSSHKIIVEPRSVVYHVGGATLPYHNSRKLYLNFRNNLFMMYKNLPKNKLYSVLFMRMCLDGVAAIKFLLSFEFKNFMAVFNAHISFYKKISVFRNKRKQIHTEKKIYNLSCVYNRSIVFDFFLKGRKKYSNLILKR